MSTPKISVVIPCYNVEKFVRECVESVCRQTLRDIEIICVNDGSTDSTLSILREFEKKDKRVKVVTKPNGGYGHTMNAGLAVAKGKYIGIVESDDFASPDMFERLYALAEEHKAQVVKSNYYTHCEGAEDAILPVLPEKLCGKLIKPTENFELFRVRPSIWAGIYLREFLEGEGIKFLESPGASFQDSSFIYKVWLCAERVWLTNEGFLHYRIDNAASSVKQQSKIFCVCDEYEEMESFLREKVHNEKELHARLCELNRLKFNTYIWNYNRLDVEPAWQFLERFSSEFARAKEEGTLELSMFNAPEKLNLEMIIKNPEQFHKRKIPCENPVVSVVIPVYNSEAYLAQCLDSLIYQTVRDIEIICVDDGSTDNSAAILQSYAERDARVIVRRQPNSGAAVARNNGISVAKGEYLSILDADDRFEHKMLEKLLEKARATNADITICKCDGFDNQTGKTKPITWSLIADMLPEKEVFSYKDMPDHIFTFAQGWAWDKLYRTDFVKKHELKFQNLKATNDMLFVFLSFVKAERITVIPDVLIHQRVNNAASISKNRHKNCDCFCYALRELKSELEKSGIFKEVERSFKNWTVNLSMWHFNSLASNRDCFMQLYKILKEFLPEMGIEPNAEEGYYFPQNLRQYKQSVEIMNTSVEDYIYSRWQEALRANEKQKGAAAPSAAPAAAGESLLSKVKRKLRSGVRLVREYGIVYTVRLAWGMLFGDRK